MPVCLRLWGWAPERCVRACGEGAFGWPIVACWCGGEPGLVTPVVRRRRASGILRAAFLLCVPVCLAAELLLLLSCLLARGLR